MRCESCRHDGWKRDRSNRCLRLRWAELRRAGDREDELPVDPDRPSQEVDSVEAEAEALALTEARTRGEDNERSVAVGHRLDEGLDFVHRRRLDRLLRL